MSGALLERMQHADPEIRRRACEECGQDGPADAVVAALVRALDDPEKSVVRAASDALVAIEASSGGTRTALARGLQADTLQARFGAASALTRILPSDPQSTTVLFEALTRGDGDMRWAALRLLIAAGPDQPDIQLELTRLATEGHDPPARRIAAFGLRDLAPAAASTERALAAASDDPDVHVRRAALSAMAALVGPAEASLIRLVEALDDADGGSRRIAAVALGALGARHRELGPRLCEPLRRVLDSPDENLRRAASRSLERIDPDRSEPMNRSPNQGEASE